MTWLLLAILALITLYLLRHEIADTADIPRHLTRCPHCRGTFECDDPLTDAEVDEVLAEIDALPEVAA
jgi:hypothetical protein